MCLLFHWIAQTIKYEQTRNIWKTIVAVWKKTVKTSYEEKSMKTYELMLAAVEKQITALTIQPIFDQCFTYR